MAITPRVMDHQRMALLEIIEVARPMWTATPKTALQALMETAPGDTPKVSIEEYAELREVLEDALDELDPMDRYVVLATVIERKPFRTLERELGASKSSLHRLRDNVLRRLESRLQNDPVVQAHLARTRRTEVTDGTPVPGR